MSGQELRRLELELESMKQRHAAETSELTELLARQTKKSQALERRLLLIRMGGSQLEEQWVPPPARANWQAARTAAGFDDGRDQSELYHRYQEIRERHQQGRRALPYPGAAGGASSSAGGSAGNGQSCGADWWRQAEQPFPHPSQGSASTGAAAAVSCSIAWRVFCAL